MSSQTTSIGSCPSHWKVVKFSTVAELKHGYQFRTTDFSDQGVKVLKITQIKGNGSIDISSCSYIDSDRLESFKNNIVNKRDILMALSGATIGKIGRYNSEEIVLQNYRVGNFISHDNEVLNKDYFYYFLTTENTYYQILANQNQSAQENIGKEDIHNMLVFLPPIHEQTAIAEILSSLDDKIDLLHRQNKTLEQLAITLFSQWFAYKNNTSKIVALGEYVETINGVSYKSSELNSSRTAMVSLKSFDRTGGFRIDGFKEFTGNYKEKQIVHEGDLIVAHTDITQDAEVIGNPALVLSHPNYETLVISMDIVKVLPKLEWVSTEFIYYLMKTREFKGHCEANANGSTVLHLSKQAIPTFEFPAPDKSLVKEFTEQARNLNQKIFLNHKQIRTLINMRDTLLPKLMSGEIKLYAN